MSSQWVGDLIRTKREEQKNRHKNRATIWCCKFHCHTPCELLNKHILEKKKRRAVCWESEWLYTGLVKNVVQDLCCGKQKHTVCLYPDVSMQMMFIWLEPVKISLHHKTGKHLGPELLTVQSINIKKPLDLLKKLRVTLWMKAMDRSVFAFGFIAYVFVRVSLWAGYLKESHKMRLTNSLVSCSTHI